jgi:hypothetical protein
MSEQMSATIIAFPRVKAAAPAPAAADPQARLQRALASLEQALEEQRIAVAAWRDSLGQLRGSVQGLGASLGTYQTRLGSLADDIDGLNREARRLDAWADAAITREDGATAEMAGPALLGMSVERRHAVDGRAGDDQVGDPAERGF